MPKYMRTRKELCMCKKKLFRKPFCECLFFSSRIISFSLIPKRGFVRPFPCSCGHANLVYETSESLLPFPAGIDFIKYALFSVFCAKKNIGEVKFYDSAIFSQWVQKVECMSVTINFFQEGFYEKFGKESFWQQHFWLSSLRQRGGPRVGVGRERALCKYRRNALSALQVCSPLRKDTCWAEKQNPSLCKRTSDTNVSRGKNQQGTFLKLCWVLFRIRQNSTQRRLRNFVA